MLNRENYEIWKASHPTTPNSVLGPSPVFAPIGSNIASSLLTGTPRIPSQITAPTGNQYAQWVEHGRPPVGQQLIDNGPILNPVPATPKPVAPITAKPSLPSDPVAISSKPGKAGIGYKLGSGETVSETQYLKMIKQFRDMYEGLKPSLQKHGLENYARNLWSGAGSLNEFPKSLENQATIDTLAKYFSAYDPYRKATRIGLSHNLQI